MYSTGCACKDKIDKKRKTTVTKVDIGFKMVLTKKNTGKKIAAKSIQYVNNPIWKDLEKVNILSHKRQRNSQKSVNCLF